MILAPPASRATQQLWLDIGGPDSRQVSHQRSHLALTLFSWNSHGGSWLGGGKPPGSWYIRISRSLSGLISIYITILFPGSVVRILKNSWPTPLLEVQFQLRSILLGGTKFLHGTLPSRGGQNMTLTTSTIQRAVRCDIDRLDGV